MHPTGQQHEFPPDGTWHDAFSGPPELREMLRRGGTLICVARNSGSGRQAFTLAAKDARGLAEALARFGCPLHRFLPSEAELIERLQGAPPVVSKDRDGKRFTNRFVELDLRRDCGVVLLLAAGTGRALDADLTQPVVTRLVPMVRKYNAVGLFGKRLDRITRNAWALSPVMLELIAVGGYVGDGHRGLFRRCVGMEALLLFFDATQSEEEALKTPTQTRNGMRSATAPQMDGERATIGSGRPVPPGLVRIRLKAGAGIGRPFLTFDRPASLPDPMAVAAGMPEVYGPDGERVDQVENVRWVLSRLGRPGPENTQEALGAELKRRRYSTDHLRRKAGPGAVVGSAHGDTVIRTIISNVDFYRTGVLPLRYGVEGVPDGKIAGIVPPDGPWATPADFARIDRWLQRRASASSAKVRGTFAGLRCTVDGVEARLSLEAKRLQEGDVDLRYRIVRMDAEPGQLIRAGKNLRLMASEISRLVAEGIASAGGKALALVSWDTSSPEATAAQRKLTSLHAEKASWEQTKLQRRAMLDDVDASGRPLCFGALRDAYVEEHNEACAALDRLDAQIGEISERIELLRVKEIHDSGSIAADELLRMIASLRDPTDLSYRALWIAAIRDLVITTTEIGDARRMDVSGNLIVGDPAAPVAIPFGGSWIRQPPARRSRREEITDRAIDAMRAGIPFPPRRPTWQVRTWIAERFGQELRAFRLMSCQDPRILRLGVAALLDHPDEPDEALAARIGEQAALIQRIREVHTASSGKVCWLGTGSRVMAALHALAAASADGEVSAQQMVPRFASARNVVSWAISYEADSSRWEATTTGWRLRRGCGYCDSVRLAPTRMVEPMGPICLDCRRDDLEIEWPADPYDRWLVGAELWT